MKNSMSASKKKEYPIVRGKTAQVEQKNNKLLIRGEDLKGEILEEPRWTWSCYRWDWNLARTQSY